MRKLASIRTVNAAEAIPNADAIERIRVLGWWVVVEKGEFLSSQCTEMARQRLALRCHGWFVIVVRKGACTMIQDGSASACGIRPVLELDRAQLAPCPAPTTLHCSELPAFPADSPVRQEWNAYRREVPRLIQEGLAGKVALIKGDTIIGIFDSFEEGVCRGRELYLMQPFLVQPIREREPLLRVRGHALPCPSFTTRSPIGK